VGSNFILISETQHVEYLIEMRSKLRSQVENKEQTRERNSYCLSRFIQLYRFK